MYTGYRGVHTCTQGTELCARVHRVQRCVHVYTGYRGVYTCTRDTEVCTRVHGVQRCVHVQIVPTRVIHCMPVHWGAGPLGERAQEGCVQGRSCTRWLYIWAAHRTLSGRTRQETLGQRTQGTCWQGVGQAKDGAQATPGAVRPICSRFSRNIIRLKASTFMRSESPALLWTACTNSSSLNSPSEFSSAVLTTCSTSRSKNSITCTHMAKLRSPHPFPSSTQCVHVGGGQS